MPWYQLQPMLARELAEYALLAERGAHLVLLQTALDVLNAMDHHAPEHCRQLARQCLVGDQAAAARLEPSVRAAQGGVHAIAHTASHVTEQPPHAVALTRLVL